MSGASGEESGGDADSASLVGDSYDGEEGSALEWQEIHVDGREEDELLRQELEEDIEAQTSVSGAWVLNIR